MTTAGGEQGLLSMAFAPHFDRNRRVYVDFTNLNGDTRVVQYRTFAANRNRVNPATKRVLLKVAPAVRRTTTAASSRSAPTACSTSRSATAARRATRT